MSNYTIFISSADNYSDLWPIFFDMFKKYWPEYKGEIVLNTEMLDYSRTDLNIRCTKVGKLGSFGKTFRAGLNMIESDVVMLIMIDYLFMGKVNDDKIKEYYDFFRTNDLDSFCLIYQNYPNQFDTDHKDVKIVKPYSENGMFSYQIAFWKKSILYQMALPHENPWASEWFGTFRAYRMKIKLACLSNERLNPIPYDFAGCLHKGKWLKNAISFLGNFNYDHDFNLRGYYEEKPQSLNEKIKIKVMLIKAGFTGSYMDLLKRKFNL